MELIKALGNRQRRSLYDSASVRSWLLDCPQPHDMTHDWGDLGDKEAVFLPGLIGAVLRQDPLEQLADRTMCLANRCPMIGSPGEVGVRERHPPEGGGAQNLSGGRTPVLAEEKPRLRADVSVPPAVQNNSGDVSLGVESRGREHFAQLHPDLTLVIAKWCREQLRAAQITLLLEGRSVMGKEDLEREHHGRIWPNGLRVRCKRW